MTEPTKVNWDTMMEIARLRPDGVRGLVAQHKQTHSPDVVGSLIGVITQARRNRWVSPLEAVEALIELLESLDVWAMASHHIPASMLGAFEIAAYEDGLPEGVDFCSLAELIQSATRKRSSPEGVFLETGVIGVCASLAVRDQLVRVLETITGGRVEVLLGLESMMRRMAASDRELFVLYESAARTAIKALQAEENAGDTAAHTEDRPRRQQDET